MCRFSVILLLLCSSLLAHGQSRIKGQIKNFYGDYLNVYLATKGADVPAKPYRLNIDDDGRFEAALPTIGSVFAHLYHYGVSIDIRLWVSPNSVDEIVIDLEDKGSARYSGTHKAANKLLNSDRVLRTEYAKIEPWAIDLLKDVKTPVELLGVVAKKKVEEQALWDEQKKAGKISEALYKVLSRETVYFWHFLALDVLAEKGMKHFEGVVSLKLDNINDPEAQKSRYYFHYLRQHFDQLLPEMDHLQRAKVFVSELDESLHQPFLAHYYFHHAAYGDRHYSLFPALRDFQKKYPKSPWTEVLKPKIDRLEDDYLISREPITEEMVIYEKASDFASIEELIAKYKGEVLYFDMWASWCGACKEGFKVRYQKPLKTFLKDKPVRVIYLSIDRESAQDKWLRDVKKYRLNSVNVRFYEQKLSGLLRFLGHEYGKPFGIPWYFIVDKEGKLVNAHAPAPDQGEALFAELSKHL